MEKEAGIPKFANEQAEADWWASKAGREFLTSRPPGKKLAASQSVQIALRLPSPDIAKAREEAYAEQI